MKYVLFPFDKIAKGSSIVIYGAGKMGREIKKQLEVTKYCNIISFVDRDYQTIDYVDNIKCISIEKIKNYNFDYILIASMAFKDDIHRSLENLGVDSNKIIEIPNDNALSANTGIENNILEKLDDYSTYTWDLVRKLLKPEL